MRYGLVMILNAAYQSVGAPWGSYRLIAEGYAVNNCSVSSTVVIDLRYAG